MKTYYQLLEDMFLGFRVTTVSGSPRESLLSTERWVGIELWKRLQCRGDGKVHYLRTKAGAEVDFIIARGGRLVPIEVKWTEHPTRGDARHLTTFLDEHPKRAPHGYVVCRCSAPLALTDRVTALPWWQL